MKLKTTGTYKTNDALLMILLAGVVILSLTLGLYLWSLNNTILALQDENYRLETQISQYRLSKPSDAQCVAWLFETDLNAARNRICGRKG